MLVAQLPILRGQFILAGDDGAVANRVGVAAGNVAIGGQVLVQPGEELDSTRDVAPVAHQVAHDGEERHHVDSGVHHPLVADVSDQGCGRARGLNVCPHAVALGAEREREEGRALG